jgi:hypothetical protein
MKGEVMQGFPPRITRIKGLSERNRLPRLGKIRLGKKVKNKNARPGCSCGPAEGCFKCSYPVETPYFVVPQEVAAVYGDKPTQLKVKVPVNSLDVVFPQAYKYYGSSRGLKCYGDLQIAFRLNEETFAMEQVPCPCPRKDKECTPTGVLNVILYEVDRTGVYQIGTRSLNSMVDIASGLQYAQCLLGQFAMVPFILKRVPITTHHKGQKQTHYTLQILIDTQSPEMQKKLPAPKDQQYALPPAEEIRPDLDGPVVSEEEIRQENLDAHGAPETGEEMSSIVTPVKQIFVRTERDPQGKPYKKYRIVTEAGFYFTCDEALKNTAQTAMKKVEFVEIGFVPDPKEGNLIKSLKRVFDEQAQ